MFFLGAAGDGLSFTKRDLDTLLILVSLNAWDTLQCKQSLECVMCILSAFHTQWPRAPSPGSTWGSVGRSQGRALCVQLSTALLWSADNSVGAIGTAGKQGFWVMLHHSRSEGAPNWADICWLPDGALCIQCSRGDSYCGLSVMRYNFHLSADIVLIVIMNFNVWLVGCLLVTPLRTDRKCQCFIKRNRR